MTRSAWKGPHIDGSLISKLKSASKNQSTKHNKLIKTWSRRSTIIPQFMGRTLEVHNGKSFVNITINEQVIGHKLGEFSKTRKKNTKYVRIYNKRSSSSKKVQVQKYKR